MSSMKQIGVLVFAAAAAILGLLLFGALLRWDGVTVNVTVTNLANLLAPVAFASAVVERAVEILISPWRDAGASKLQRTLTTLQALPVDAASSTQRAQQLQSASDALDDYRGQTQQYAFAVSSVLSMCVAIAGVRAFQPFLDATKFADLAKAHPHQHLFFLLTDVALTAALLAGGADGVHSVVNAVTTFFDKTADTTAKQATA